MAVPVLRAFFHPVGRKVVSVPTDPIDVAREDDLVAGAPPKRYSIVASGVRDAWGHKSDVTVGSCWLSKAEDGTITAFSSVCPHLGCSISYAADADEFRCPCHDSVFARDGEKRGAGPAKRGLDPLQVIVQDGRVKVIYQRFRNDVSTREVV